MRRAENFAVAGMWTGIAVVDAVTLAHQFARGATMREAATTMFFIVLNLAVAGWFVGRGLEVDR